MQHLLELDIFLAKLLKADCCCYRSASFPEDAQRRRPFINVPHAIKKAWCNLQAELFCCVKSYARLPNRPAGAKWLCPARSKVLHSTGHVVDLRHMQVTSAMWTSPQLYLFNE